MDDDLVSEVRRLESVAAKDGLQLFRYACFDSWTASPGSLSRSPLFRACTPDGKEGLRPDGQLCGCLVEVHFAHYLRGPRVAWTDEWTEAIQRDKQIPDLMAEMHPNQLRAFAEWQQKMRRLFSR